MTTRLAARIAEPEFAASLQAIANYHGRRGFEASEVLAHITLKLLERGAKDSRFARQDDNYIKTFAAWKARNYSAHARTYEAYVDPELFDSPLSDDLDAPVYGELIADDTADPATIAEARFDLALVRDAVEQMTGKQRQVAGLLLRGYTPGEAATKLGLSPQSVSHILARVRSALLEQGLTA